MIKWKRLLMVALLLGLSFPAQAASDTAQDHDLDYMDENSRNPDVLTRAYARNSHLQKLLDLGLYQVVFDDDPSGVEAFVAAGAHVEGVKGLPLSPMAFATWRHEVRTMAALARQGAKPVDEANDMDNLVRLTMETVSGVQEMLKKEFTAAEREYRKRTQDR